MSIPKTANYLIVLLFSLFLGYLCLYTSSYNFVLNQPIFYYVRTFGSFLGLLVLPGIWIAFLYLVIHSSWRPYILPKTLCLIALTIINAVTGFWVFLYIIFSSSRQLSTIDIKNHVYRLDSFEPACMQDCSSRFAIIWQCDQTALICKIIYESDDFFAGYVPQLIYQPENDALKLMINGNVIYALNYLNSVDGL